MLSSDFLKTESELFESQNANANIVRITQFINL